MVPLFLSWVALGSAELPLTAVVASERLTGLHRPGGPIFVGDFRCRSPPLRSFLNFIKKVSMKLQSL